MQRAHLRELTALFAARRPFVVATVVQAKGSVPGKPGARLVLRPDGTFTGTVGGAGLEEKVKALCLEALRDRKARLVHYDLANWKPQGLNSVCGGSVDVAIEYIAPNPHLLLFGGGHVTKALADLCGTLDYAVTVVDDRPEYVERQRFPNADGLVAADPAKWLESADVAPYSHLYIMGYNHEQDTDILEQAVRRFPGYVGVIGSRAKRESMLDRLCKRGFADDDLARVHCPVGLPLGGDTPGEIAVSILAEVIQDAHADAR